MEETSATIKWQTSRTTQRQLTTETKKKEKEERETEEEGNLRKKTVATHATNEDIMHGTAASGENQQTRNEDVRATHLMMTTTSRKCREK